MANQGQQFCVSFLTGAGSAVTNKEYFAGVELANFACWVIAERLDSCSEKESARLAAEEVIRAFTAQPLLSRAKIKEYLLQAHNKLLAESVNNKIKLRAGLLIVITDYRKMIYAVTGNVRLYHLRQGQINFRSKDQTMAQVMLDAGNLTEAEINLRNERNGLISFLGIAAEFKPFVSPAYQLQEDDRLFFCNVNFWENFTNQEITAVFAQTAESEAGLAQLKNELVVRKPQIQNYILATLVFKQVRRSLRLNLGTLQWCKLAVGFAVSVVILMGVLLGAHLGTSGKMAIMQPKPSVTAVICRNKLRQPQQDIASPVAPKSTPLADDQGIVTTTPSSKVLLRQQRLAVHDGKIQATYRPKYEPKTFSIAEKPGESLAPKQAKTAGLVEAKTQDTVRTGPNRKKGNEPAPPRPIRERPEKEAIKVKQPQEMAAVPEATQGSGSPGSYESITAVSESSVSTDREQRTLRAKSLEITGDECFRQEKYGEALEFYKQSYRIYRELGMREMAVLVDRKINLTIKNKLIFLFKHGLKSQ